MARTPQKTPHKGLREPWKKGECPNPNGRPVGQRNYATIYKEAIRKIAESQNMTPEEIEDVMVQSGLKHAIKGDYRFYQDTLDRLHGKPKGEIDFKGTIALTKAITEADD